jgi:hypothetical protein
MAFPDQIEKLLTRLTELTGRDKVEWQETANPNTYLAPVGKFTVTVGKAGSEVYGGYSFQILDSTGKASDRALAAFTGPEKSAGQHQNWERLRNLHELARRRALHLTKSSPTFSLHSTKLLEG